MGAFVLEIVHVVERIGRIGNEFIVMPTHSQLEESDLDLVVSGTRKAITMIEGFAREMSEEHMLQGILFAHKQIVTVDWTRVADTGSADAFAAAVRATRRSSGGITAVGPALLAAAATFDHLPEPAGHRMIDISGDGIANFGLPPAAARDRIVAAGIAINGLAIVTDEPWVADYYRNNVIGGPLAFVVIARTFDDFADAMLRKLVQEVAGASATGALSSAQMQ